MPFIATKSLMLVRNTPGRATGSKLLPAGLRTTERFRKTRSASDRPSAEFGSHAAYRFPQKHEFRNILMRDKQFHKFIIITIIMPWPHDSVIRRENVLGDLLAR